jgi:hypothetical protein
MRRPTRKRARHLRRGGGGVADDLVALEPGAEGRRFFGEFGKLSYIHDHELPFVNRPLALDQYIGGESRTDGAQLNWLLPTPHYVSLTTGFGVGFGGDSPLNNPGSYRP